MLKLTYSNLFCTSGDRNQSQFVDIRCTRLETEQIRFRSFSVLSWSVTSHGRPGSLTDRCAKSNMFKVCVHCCPKMLKHEMWSLCFCVVSQQNDVFRVSLVPSVFHQELSSRLQSPEETFSSLRRVNVRFWVNLKKIKAEKIKKTSDWFVSIATAAVNELELWPLLFIVSFNTF